MGCWICWVFWTLVTLVGWDESLSHVMTYLRAGKSGVEWDEMVQKTWKYEVAKKNIGKSHGINFNKWIGIGTSSVKV